MTVQITSFHFNMLNFWLFFIELFDFFLRLFLFYKSVSIYYNYKFFNIGLVISYLS